MRIEKNRFDILSEEAEAVIGAASAIDGDWSLPALLRAITINRGDFQTLSDLADKTCVIYAYCNTTSAVNYELNNIGYYFKLIEAKDGCVIDPVPQGWTTFDSAPYYLNRYLSQITKTEVFINTEHHSVYVVCHGKITHRLIQALESMLWVVMPWYFPEKTDEVISFFRKLAVGNKQVSESEAEQALVAYCNAATAKADFRDMRLHSLLDGIADQVRRSQILEYRTDLNTIQSEISTVMQRLEIYYSDLETKQELLSALEAHEPEKDDSVYRFFKQRPYLSVSSVEGNRLRYGVVSTLEQYDDSAVKRMFDNPQSWACRDFRSEIPYLKELFVNRRGVIKVGAMFLLTNMRLVIPLPRIKPNCSDIVPNPHIYYHACSGGNEKYYAQYAQSGDWQLAIEQSISATSNWNVADITVSNELFLWLLSNNRKKCIYFNEGSKIKKVSDDMPLVSYDEFKNFIDEMNSKQTEEENNG